MSSFSRSSPSFGAPGRMAPTSWRNKWASSSSAGARSSIANCWQNCRVEARVAVEDRVAGAVDAGGVGHVDRDGGEPLSRELVEQVGSPAADDDGAAGRGEAAGELEADSRGSAGDEDGAVASPMPTSTTSPGPTHARTAGAARSAFTGRCSGKGPSCKALAESPGLTVPVLAVGAGGGPFTAGTMSQAASSEISSVQLDGVGHYAAIEGPRGAGEGRPRLHRRHRRQRPNLGHSSQGADIRCGRNPRCPATFRRRRHLAEGCCTYGRTSASTPTPLQSSVIGDGWTLPRAPSPGRYVTWSTDYPGPAGSQTRPGLKSPASQHLRAAH